MIIKIDKKYKLDISSKGRLLPTRRNLDLIEKARKDENFRRERFGNKFDEIYEQTVLAVMTDPRKKEVTFRTPQAAQEGLERAELISKLDNEYLINRQNGRKPDVK